MTRNKLKSTESKTEFIIFGTNKQGSRVFQNSIDVVDDRIKGEKVEPYLKDMLSIQVHVRNTRLSIREPRLIKHKSNLKFEGDRVFIVSAPKL